VATGYQAGFSCRFEENWIARGFWCCLCTLISFIHLGYSNDTLHIRDTAESTDSILHKMAFPRPKPTTVSSSIDLNHAPLMPDGDDGNGACPVRSAPTREQAKPEAGISPSGPHPIEERGSGAEGWPLMRAWPG